MLYTLIVTLAIITAILLILVVLVQNTKGGAGPTFGGTAVQIVGVQRGTDLVERITWTLIVSLIVFCLASKPLLRLDQPTNFESPNVKKAKEAKPVLPKTDSPKKDKDKETENKSQDKTTDKKNDNK